MKGIQIRKVWLAPHISELHYWLTPPRLNAVTCTAKHILLLHAIAGERLGFFALIAQALAYYKARHAGSRPDKSEEGTLC